DLEDDRMWNAAIDFEERYLSLQSHNQRKARNNYRSRPLACPLPRQRSRRSAPGWWKVSHDDKTTAVEVLDSMADYWSEDALIVQPVADYTPLRPHWSDREAIRRPRPPAKKPIQCTICYESACLPGFWSLFFLSHFPRSFCSLFFQSLVARRPASCLSWPAS